MKTSRTIIFADGSCYPNPGPAGWAWWDPRRGVFGSGRMHNGTNNRAELWAVVNAIHNLEHKARGKHITVVSDSKYVVDQANKLSSMIVTCRPSMALAATPVVNRSLWQQFVTELRNAYEKDPKIEFLFKHVRGHQGIFENEVVDCLAGNEMTTLHNKRARLLPSDIVEGKYDLKSIGAYLSRARKGGTPKPPREPKEECPFIRVVK